MAKKVKGDVRLVWLKAFVAVAETQSYSRAAERLETSQPNASRYVDALETWLSKVLVDDNRPVKLTPDGETFLPVARNVIDLLDSSRAEVPTAAQAEQRKISAKDIVVSTLAPSGEAECLPD